MTNSEYEAACVAAATTAAKFEGEYMLKQWDERIAILEAALAKAQEARREVVNRYDLNKCEHDFVYTMAEAGFPIYQCRRCPEELRCPFCQFVVDETDFEDHGCAACGAYLE